MLDAAVQEPEVEVEEDVLVEGTVSLAPEAVYRVVLPLVFSLDEELVDSPVSVWVMLPLVCE